MLSHLNVFLSLAISFTIVYFVIPKIVNVSTLKNLFDVPNHRSAAKKIVPNLGGIALIAGFSIGLMVSSNQFNIDETKYMFVSIIAMFLLGLKDDIIGLDAKKKLIAQIVVAIYLVILGDFRIVNFHGILGIEEIGYLPGVIFSVVAIVGIINAFNLIDGIDGLAGGVGLLGSLVYGFWFMNAGDLIYALASFSLAGSLIAFLFYNVFGRANKIFMGDTGSLMLGTIMAIFTIHFNMFEPKLAIAAHGLPAISLAIIIVPIVDTIRVFAIRISQRRSPFTADMNHIHHKLLKLTNGNHLSSSSIIIGTNGLIILFAFLCIEQLGNGLTVLMVFLIGFTLSCLPFFFLKWKNNPTMEAKKENKSIFTFHLFIKKNKK